MKIVRRKVIEHKDKVDVTVLQVMNPLTFQDAVEYMDKLYKTDKTLYRFYMNKYSTEIANCDDGYEYGHSYYFTINNVTIEAYIEGIERVAEKLFKE